MKKERFSSELLQRSVTRISFENGFTAEICPMPGFRSIQAMLTVGAGSADTAYGRSGVRKFLPAGTAHFLEHRMFDTPDGDALERFCALGASANAMTSFDSTSYCFSCTSNFAESLGVLLGFVSRPYFTPDSVRRERGIIAEEIRMYADSPDWAVLQNLLRALYHRHPVREDIAGTLSSIQTISPDVLTEAYRAFYQPGNMILTVAGNADEETVAQMAGEVFGTAASCPAAVVSVPEPPSVVRREIIRNMPVAQPLFEIGFKSAAAPEAAAATRFRFCDGILLDLIAGESTDFYHGLHEEGLINASFDGDVVSGRDFGCCVFGGESRRPREVFHRLLDRIELLRRDGIPREDLSRIRKARYGRCVALYGRGEAVAELMSDAHFGGMKDIFYPMEFIRDISADELIGRLREDFSPDLAALSVVEP